MTEPETWWYELENSGRSQAYESKEQALAALPELTSPRAQMGPRYSRPVRLVSSAGRKIELGST